jgi:nicotinamidase-related amidase
MRSGIFPFKYRRLDKDSAAALLIDRQSGLCDLIEDFTPAEFKNNVLALACCCRPR